MFTSYRWRFLWMDKKCRTEAAKPWFSIATFSYIRVSVYDTGSRRPDFYRHATRRWHGHEASTILKWRGCGGVEHWGFGKPETSLRKRLNKTSIIKRWNDLKVRLQSSPAVPTGWALALQRRWQHCSVWYQWTKIKHRVRKSKRLWGKSWRI